MQTQAVQGGSSGVIDSEAPQIQGVEQSSNPSSTNPIYVGIDGTLPSANVDGINSVSPYIVAIDATATVPEASPVVTAAPTPPNTPSDTSAVSPDAASVANPPANPGAVLTASLVSSTSTEAGATSTLTSLTSNAKPVEPAEADRSMLTKACLSFGNFTGLTNFYDFGKSVINFAINLKNGNAKEASEDLGSAGNNLLIGCVKGAVVCWAGFCLATTGPAPAAFILVGWMMSGNSGIRLEQGPKAQGVKAGKDILQIDEFSKTHSLKDLIGLLSDKKYADGIIERIEPAIKRCIGKRDQNTMLGNVLEDMMEETKRILKSRMPEDHPLKDPRARFDPSEVQALYKAYSGLMSQCLAEV